MAPAATRLAEVGVVVLPSDPTGNFCSLADLLPEAQLHFNHAFFRDMDLASFITKMPGRVTVDRMLSRAGFRRRRHPIVLHELLVPLMQGWDSVVLSTEVEIGGHDQLFNFQLARRLQRAEGQELLPQ